ncbi:MAG TPA: UDP-N-acetylmuramoyl-L-alanine--D-glutamate ligase [Acidimicrobiia bacterium]|nr:UDP-N-acetylmuramoyl-L-alanine--D-glutamate ligase [Acidimicrobiia bacterium]
MTALVIGAAVSGRAAAHLLHADGEKVVVYDRDPAAVAGIEADEAHAGAWDRRYLDGVDLVVVSPGIPEHAAPIVDAIASGLPLWSELELGYRHLTVPVVGVTATNGKTTITELAAEMLTASGVRALAVGNIGDPLSGAVDMAVDVLVVEASSFQLRFVETFHARAAVLLNVAPDHLDWHGTFDAYLAAKQRILERQEAGDVVVFDGDDPGAVAAVAGAVGRRVPVSGARRPEGGWGRERDCLVVGGAVIPLEGLVRSDDVMVVDLAAAAAAAMHVGATPEGVTQVATSYHPGHHRREVVGTWGGVTWVNDSKATNPHAAVAAIRSYESVVVIAGGRNKGLDVTVIPREPNVRHVVAIGEAAAELAAFERVTVVDDLDEAVELADRIAVPGDTVLLAPGCASFDMFRSYADRGARFSASVLKIKGDVTWPVS